MHTVFWKLRRQEDHKFQTSLGYTARPCRKKRGRKNTPIRYVVEHVYSGTESMEGLLTVVSEEAARKNVEEKLRNGSMGAEKKAV